MDIILTTYLAYNCMAICRARPVLLKDTDMFIVFLSLIFSHFDVRGKVGRGGGSINSKLFRYLGPVSGQGPPRIGLFPGYQCTSQAGTFPGNSV